MAPVLMLGISLVISFTLYGPVLDNAFVFDDPLDLTRGEGRSYLSLLTSSEGYSYYRPLPFLFWKLSRDLLGFYDHGLLHSLPIVAHALAGWLLFLIVRRNGFGLWAIVPAVLFLTYPFSYQDVMIAGVVFHPLVTMWLLASLNLYDLGRRTAGRRSVAFHMPAIGAALLALWTHESGVVVLPLVVGMEVIHLWRRSSRRPSPWTLGYLLATVAFLATWYTVEKAPFGDEASTGDLRPKALFFLQGFSYPFSAQIQPLDERLGIAPGLLEAGLLALIVVPGAALLAARLRSEGRVEMPAALVPAAAGLGIAVAAALPPMLRLSWEYVVDAPRLLYLVGLGAAIFWGTLPALDFGRRRLTVVWRVVTLSLIGLVIVQSWAFVERRNEMFAAGTQAVEALAASGAQHDGGRLLVVNMPSWLALDEYEYPYGHLGAQAVPVYVGLDRAIYVNSSRLAEVQVQSIEFFPEVSDGHYSFGPHGAPSDPQSIDQLLREGYSVVRIDREGDGFAAREGGRLEPGPASEPTSPVALDGVEVVVGSVRAASIDDRVALYLSWHVGTPLDPGSRVAVQLRTEDGDVVGSYEGASLLGLSSPEQWRAGDRVDDVLWFDEIPAGRYEVWAGVLGLDDTVAGNAGLVAVGRVSVP